MGGGGRVYRNGPAVFSVSRSENLVQLFEISSKVVDWKHPENRLDHELHLAKEAQLWRTGNAPEYKLTQRPPDQQLQREDGSDTVQQTVFFPSTTTSTTMVGDDSGRVWSNPSYEGTQPFTRQVTDNVAALTLELGC